MIKFKDVFIKYINSFYSLYNFNYNFTENTLINGDATIGSKAILRIIAKIDKHYNGAVFIDNINLKDIRDKELNLAFIPENFTLFKLKSVEKNLIYPLTIRKINKKQAKIKVYKILKQFNLEHLYKIKVYKLNKNQQKIITLLRAIVREPKYILIEDFFKTLDDEYLNLCNKIISSVSNKSIIIACEETNDIDCYKNFKKLELKKGDN